jgi:DNA-binding FadR family transcriptional regulator
MKDNERGTRSSKRKPGATNQVGIVTPISIRGLHGQLVESIGMSIAAGELAVREQIVPEALAEEFGVSRTVVREVLKVLEAKGMVGARPRTGTRVTAPATWNLLDPDVIRWRSTGPDSTRQLQELLGIRSAIEPLAARTAAAAATPANVRSMAGALDAMCDAVHEEDWDAFTEADVAFHRALLSSSGSMVIDQLADPIEAALRVRHRLHLVPASLTGTAESHQAILDAIVRRDGPQAELMSRRIVDVAGSEIMAALYDQIAHGADDADSVRDRGRE